MSFDSNMKANLNYFYKFYQKNIKKLSFFLKIGISKHQIGKMSYVKIKII